MAGKIGKMTEEAENDERGEYSRIVVSERDIQSRIVGSSAHSVHGEAKKAGLCYAVSDDGGGVRTDWQRKQAGSIGFVGDGFLCIPARARAGSTDDMISF